MRNPFRKKTPSSEDHVVFILAGLLRDKESDLRQMFARVARSEAKNFFAFHLGTELEKFQQELEGRSARVLANLGSAASTVGQHTAETMRMLHGIPDDAALPQCLTGVCPQRFATCTECTIPAKESGK